MVPPSPACAKSVNPGPRPPGPAELDISEPRQPWYRNLLSSKEKSPRLPKTITPDSSADLASTPTTARKKVGWSEKYDYKDPPKIITDKKIAFAQALSPLTPSAERKASKSILKPHHVPDPIHLIEPFGGSEKTSIPNPLILRARMLESISKQLAGQDRSSRLDAYTTLSGALKACDNVPDRKALSDKMDLILQFIRRDMNAKHESGALDVQLAKEALVLISSFLYKKSISDMLTPDFNCYLVDYALQTFENPGLTKEIARHLMFIMAQQKFSPRIMTAERVARLISALHQIEDFVQGKSIVEQRISIYRTLLRQSRPHMISNLDWLEDLLSDMFSSYSNIRTAAIAFGEEVGLDLGTESKVSSKLMEIFKGADGRDSKYGDFYADRLRKMVAKKPPGPAPRIWAVVILFLRARPQQVEHWAFIKQWLDVIKVCFNSGDQDTRIATNLAWNRMVFVIGQDEKVSSNMMHTLSQPLIGQLQRKDVRKASNSDNLYRKSTLSGICNLLYYAIKPNATPAQLDIFWDSYISNLIGKSLTPADYTENPASAEQDLNDACNILRGLFDSHTKRLWTSTRALNDNLVTAAELPGLDPRWLRKSAPRVFQVLSPILELLYWDFAFPKSKILLLWETYISSISFAAAKEVKTSSDTMACLAFLFSTLYKIWQKGPDGLHTPAPHRKDEANFFVSFQVLVTTVISGLGVLSFTERLLSMGQQDDFIVVATPSHRPGKIKGEVRSPLNHLFLLLASVSPGSKYDSKFLEMAESILTPFFEARRLSKGKMDLVKDLLEILPTDNIDPCGALWTILAKFATAAVNFRDDSFVTSSTHDTRPLGGEYRSVARILEVGIDLSPKEPLEGWKYLFQALVISATTDSGHGGRAIVVVEPTAKTLNSKWRTDSGCHVSNAQYCQILVEHASYPKDRPALDAARRRLWGSATAGLKIHTFDPYSHFYEYTSRCLEYYYTELLSSDESSICNLLGELEALLGRCPKALFTEAVVKLQNGIVCWIRDEELKLHASSISGTVNSLWAKICSLLCSTTTDIPKSLNDLEPLLCSGLESKRVSIANMAIEMWKETFGSFKGDLQYPPMVKEVLSRLLPMADLPLPAFPESSEDQTSDNYRQPLVFLDTQTDSTIPSVNLPKVSKKAFSSSINQSSKQKGTVSSPQVVIKVKKTASRKRYIETTPEPGKRKSRKKGSVKLRHDDSQIQFEAIAGSSPLSEETYDSQLLTERQKEVRERQAGVAAMFSDIRSSPHRSLGPTPKDLDNEIELPSHLSSSKLLLDTPANIERQSTPDTQVIENQDASLASSPTPARCLLDSKVVSRRPSPLTAAVNSQKSFLPTHKVNNIEIPSSPPQAETRNHKPQNNAHKDLDQSEQSPLPADSSIYESALVPLTSSDEFNVTSFPTNSPDGPNEDLIIDNLPEAIAQTDLYDFDTGQTMSTYKSTPSHSGGDENLDVTIELTSSEEKARDVSLQKLAIEQRASNAQKIRVVETIKDFEIGSDLVRPSISRRGQRHAIEIQMAPDTPEDVLLDAKISGTSSNGIPSESETFEDALTSPRALQHRMQKLSEAVFLPNDTSSPLSDFDEFSFIRLAKSVDRKSAENRAGTGYPAHAPTELSTQPLNITIAETPNIIPVSERRSTVCSVPQSSAIPSLIPETPAHLMKRNDKNNDKNNMPLELAADDSDTASVIIVMPRVRYQELQPNNSSQSPKPAQRNNTPFKTNIENKDKENTLTKKRKFDSTFEAGSGVSDSQEALRDVQSAPTSKKRKFRSVNTPEPAIIKSFFSTPKSAQSQRPNQSQRSNRATQRSTRSLKAKPIPDNISSMSVANEFSSAPEIMEANSSIVANGRLPAETPSNEVLEERTLGETKPGEPSSPALDEPELDSVEETLLQSQIAEEMELVSQQFTENQQEKVQQPALAAPTCQSIKERLLSLVKDLTLSTLSRREVGEIEDAFMDAKSELYRAGQRGRHMADD